MTAEDEVRRVVQSYSFLLDDRRYDDLAQLFAADGELVIRDTVHKGPGAVIAAVRRVEPARPGVRFVGPTMVRLDAPDQASAWSDMIAVMPGEDGTFRVTALNRYYDTLQLEGTSWVFVRRVMRAPSAERPVGGPDDFRSNDFRTTGSAAHE